ncbi:MAG: hypothetical protein M1821_001730 [Bathelium mastoideum]|nr:MAG: hypothetical protein M1821_001730 [Bathelium mastoideum]KAI9691628.1 MAG: hypothetical protein M1822_007699 [Bathelium mastoideum]
MVKSRGPFSLSDTAGTDSPGSSEPLESGDDPRKLSHPSPRHRPPPQPTAWAWRISSARFDASSRGLWRPLAGAQWDEKKSSLRPPELRRDNWTADAVNGRWTARQEKVDDKLMEERHDTTSPAGLEANAHPTARGVLAVSSMARRRGD